MNTKLALAGVLVVLAVGATLTLRKTPGTAVRPDSQQGNPSSSATDAGQPSRAEAALDSPGSIQTPNKGGLEAPAGEKGERAAPQESALELVTPLLELNLVAAGSAVAGSDDGPQTDLDTLLEGRHGTKTREQLNLSLRSIRYLLDLQRDPNSIPKEQVLSAEAIQALEIEAAWLKERIFR